MLSVSAYSAGKTMYVQEKNVPVKASASLFAKQTATVNYATAVEVLATKGSLTKIRVIDNPKITGWVKSSALTSKKLSLLTKVSTDAEEIALAGKGSINILNGTLSEAKNDQEEDEDDISNAK